MNGMVDPYERIALYYDLEFEDFAEDIDLYLAFAQRTGSPILELGCGTGRLLLPLARAGFTVVGVDRSPAMLARARQRLHAAGFTDIALYQTDVVHLEPLPSGTFRLAIWAINGFLHLLTLEEQRQALSEVHRVLVPGGLLLLDVLHPTPSQLTSWDGRSELEGPWHRAPNELVYRWSTRRVIAAEQRIAVTLLYDRHPVSGGPVSREAVEYQLRYVHRYELVLLLEETGFALEAVYGSYQLDPLVDESPIMLAVAQAQ